MAGNINGFSLAYTAAGAVVMWSGIKGWTISATFKALLTGTTPTSVSEPIAVNTTPSNTAAPSQNSPGTDQAVTSAGSPPSTSNGQQALQQAAAARGWGSGAEWTALQNIEMHEAGYNPQAKNPSSGAFGMAQALGHGGSGTACPSTGENNYGGYGLTNAQAQSANCGNAGAQALWMVNYIAATYGTPSAAWNQYFAHPGGVGYY